ncbi:hypothetical protein NM688_g1715 [Phlebia brevispora]|uniref:Uncharacterized protein n=1 Tax=Phlebia brevispora TaxID=194682 RepID=A0ACC1TB04_9APHY|nr:hypothetical protein NM688_g1715 [Phlebia brevispora]
MSIAVYALGIVVLSLFLRSLFSPHSFRHLPTVGGPSAPLLSYIGAHKYVNNAISILQEGYDKYKGGTFKVPMISRWLVVITGPKLVDEVQKLPDDKASFLEASADLSSVKYMFGSQVHKNPYHVTIIRQQLTHNLAALFPEVIDEIETAFRELVPAHPEDWVSIPALATMKQIVSRASNRVFLGLPYCRDPVYLDMALNITRLVGKGRLWIDMFPEFLKPLATKFIANIDGHVDAGLECLKDLIYPRIRDVEKYGDKWTDKPSDLLQWVIDEERKSGHIDARNVMKMIFMLNFVAIHTSSNSVTHALYHLAANPEFVSPLREEIEAVIETDGWTKIAMGKMPKLDSFMRESQRLNGINGVSLKRKILKDVTLSDGTFLPGGTILVTPSTATHMDEDNYPDPTVFDPWRFSELREDGEEMKYQLVSTSANYVAFGLGKHACPGRFFAANELKAVMAHIIMNYDVKAEKEGVRPPNQWFGLSLMPHPTAKVLFRKRRN